ncbi:hypothetical protein SpCBS45565_g01033 [Spizellomyces sp. 'palustris']|nr:hypothetical protein SpCBS45565_g01033 [Spizellomyces sp. 'palustris']
MQRPSTRLISEYKLTSKFRQLGIGSIFNLEEFGEHASCGDGIELTSGFSYLPETLFVLQFEEYVKPFRVYFPGICSKSPTEYSSVSLIAFETFLENQRRYFHGKEQRQLRFVPKVVWAIVEKLTEMCEKEDMATRVVDAIRYFEGLAVVPEKMIDLQAEINSGNWSIVNSFTDPIPLVHTLLYWITSLKDPLVLSTHLASLQTSDHLTLLHQMDKGTLHTLNTLLNPFRSISTPPSPLRDVFRSLAVLTTHHRTWLKYPFKPQLLYAKDILPPLPGQKSSKVRSRQASERPVEVVPTQSGDPGVLMVDKSELEPLIAFLKFLYENCRAGADGRPLSEDVNTVGDEGEEDQMSGIGPAALVQESAAARREVRTLQLTPFTSTHSLTALPSSPLTSQTPQTPHPSTYWASVLILLDTLTEAKAFSEPTSHSLRKLCLQKDQGIEIAYEAYGREEVGEAEGYKR